MESEPEAVTCPRCRRSIELRDLEDRRRFHSGEPCRAELREQDLSEEDTRN